MGHFFKTIQRKILMFLDDVSFVIIHLNFRGGDKKGASWKSEHCLALSLQGDACEVIRLGAVHK